MLILFESKISILIFFLIASSISAQEVHTEKFDYLSPLPGSSNVTPYTTIIIREGSNLKDSNILNIDILEVTGSKSGIHKGEILLLENSKTILFKPFTKFYDYEVVTVQLNGGIPEDRLKNLPQLIFSFKTGRDNSQIPVPEYCDLLKNENLIPNDVMDDLSPLSIPQLSVTTNNNPSGDYLFLGLSTVDGGHLLIVDNDLIPVFYKKVRGTIFDFKYQTNDELTYNIYPVYSYGMDNSGKSIRQFFAPTSYALDIHDLQVLEDNSYYVLAREFPTINMSKYVTNGDSSAIIQAHTIHHIDADNNEIWRWRTIDHYDILDVDEYIDLTQHTIDWTHCNSIEIDYDGNILLSTRNFNEITKINRLTGDIIWRFGGEKNQFLIHNDIRGFSRQHDVRRLSNGNLAFFNNGNHLLPEYSSFIEYELREESFNAVLVGQYSRNQSVYTASRGGIQELDNGNTIISWGEHQAPSITEVNDYDSVEFEIEFTTGAHQYRAYRFEWKTDLFTLNTDTIDFGLVNRGDSSLQSIVLYNRNDKDITINEVLLSSSDFIIKDTLPIIIPSTDKISLNVMFKPNTNGDFTDKLNIRSVNNFLLLGQQVTLTGTTDLVSSLDEIYSPESHSLSQNYPNPFNPSTIVNFSIPQNEFVKINIYNALGETVLSLINREFEAGIHSVNFVNENLSSGIYFYKMIAGSFSNTKKLILLK